MLTYTVCSRFFCSFFLSRSSRKSIASLSKVVDKTLLECGNGIVETGEDCDGDNACCSNCRFTSGSTCSAGECCNNCQIKSAANQCTLANGDKGICGAALCQAAGTCTRYSSGGSSLQSGCGFANDGCQFRCETSDGGYCFPTSQIAYQNAPDGSICGCVHLVYFLSFL